MLNSIKNLIKKLYAEEVEKAFKYEEQMLTREIEVFEGMIRNADKYSSEWMSEVKTHLRESKEQLADMYNRKEAYLQMI